MLAPDPIPTSVVPLDGTPLRPCPACGAPGRVIRNADEIADDIDVAATWWRAEASVEDNTLQWPVHARPATVAECCGGCGTIWRADPGLRWAAEEWYRHDRYDHDTLRLLHEHAYSSLLAEAGWLDEHLVPGSAALEIGSYVGGFLRCADERGCDVVGVDVGEDALEFCRSLGLRVAPSHELEHIVDLRAGRFDSVWILNCFDQLPDPTRTLGLAQRALCRRGHLVIRTPDADAIRRAYVQRGGAMVQALRTGLWGVPFLHCFSRTGLVRMLRRAGFDDVVFRSRTLDDGTDAGWLDVIATRR
jgi:SAM-dependent methyltransferase